MIYRFELIFHWYLSRLICRIFARLPTGHTHEDIDALFGTIYKSFKSTPVETLEDYATTLKDAFKNASKYGFTASVEDVYCVPDYKAFLTPFIDKEFGKIHRFFSILAYLHKYLKPTSLICFRLTDTQHHWRFESVENSSYFPFGCKTAYKAYSSDQVVEFEKKNREKCLTPIGKLTGLEPTTVSSN